LRPPEIVELAARLGCDGVTINPGIVTSDDMDGKIYRLDNDRDLRFETARKLTDTGITLDLVDALILTPDFSLPEMDAVIDTFQELGARVFSVATIETDPARYRDNLEALFEQANVRGATLAVEFYRLFGGLLPSLQAAVELATCGRYPGLKIVVDLLHLIRADETPGDLAAIDPSLIGAAQIADGSLAWPGDDAYLHEAIFERAVPGEGEFPLREFLAAIPADVVVSPEVPLKSKRDAGLSIEDCARLGIEATRRLNAQVAERRESNAR
jgi:sugar phosphate isomerase/epimerase